MPHPLPPNLRSLHQYSLDFFDGQLFHIKKKIRPASFLSIKVLGCTQWKDVTQHYMGDSYATKIPNLLSQILLSFNMLSPYLSWIGFCLGENRTSFSSHKAPFCNTLDAASQSMHILAVWWKTTPRHLLFCLRCFLDFLQCIECTYFSLVAVSVGDLNDQRKDVLSHYIYVGQCCAETEKLCWGSER